MYERAGGDPFFDALTRRFYDAVAVDPVLRPLYPEDPEGFEAARRHLRDFLIQFWGGPTTYSDERGHPRLRMRHTRFAIGQTERDAWVHHMTEAVRAGHLGPLDEQQMLSYFSGAATQLINQQEAAG
ncbi:MAG: globin [Acidimicrobiaceae bacterium]|nr:globin [Acidimicrobiaceae bacterium]